MRNFKVIGTQVLKLAFSGYALSIVPYNQYLTLTINDSLNNEDTLI